MNSGQMINHRASLGSEIVQLKERIPELEKQARKTPPKHLAAEIQKVKAAKVQLISAQERLVVAESEWKAATEWLREKGLV